MLPHFRIKNLVQGQLKHSNSSDPIHTLEVNAVRFLGLEIDNSLKWDIHINNLSKKLTSTIFTLYSLRSLVHNSTLLLAYFGLFQSKLSYGVAFWGGSNSGMKRLLKLQKRAVRTIFFLGPCDSYKTYFISEKILTLPCIYIFIVSQLTFKKIIQTVPKVHNHKTRGKDNSLPLTFRLTLFQKNIEFLASKIFNKLPSHIKEIHSFLLFKKTLKNWLLLNPFYSIQEFLNHSPWLIKFDNSVYFVYLFICLCISYI